MTFYEKYEGLCNEIGLKPQSPEMLKITGVSSGAISGWKNGSLPKSDVIVRLAKHFRVTTDYLLGLSEMRYAKPQNNEEAILLSAYRSSDTEGKFRIIQVCMNEQDKARAEKKDAG